MASRLPTMLVAGAIALAGVLAAGAAEARPKGWGKGHHAGWKMKVDKRHYGWTRGRHLGWRKHRSWR